ncbi:MAG: hypothetical protein HXX13_03905 [Bacteroidetes bacterium]|nr:hypothetical protein [Bacteroidota bacterium]
MLRKKTINVFLLPVIVISLLSLVNAGCRKDEINKDSSFHLSFSSDTVVFDTVFTSIGSQTQRLMVRNSSNQRVVISSVKLAGGSASPFRINIDGEAAFEVNDLEIGAKDSAFIFVKVTIDPNQQNNPLIATDSILFETNGNFQNVKLVAWGQDAHFFNHDTLNGDITFTADKPYVIYGMLVADSLCKINIEPGAKIYFHNNSGLLIKNGASIVVNGTLEDPVLFRSDKLGVDGQKLTDQWIGIEIEGGSSGNRFTYADIQNGKVGILLDASELSVEPRLILYNTVINNMVNYGLLSIQSNVWVLNCRITNCGGYTVALEGGSYDFRNCTLSNYWNESGRHYPSLLLGNNFYDQKGTLIASPLLNAYFGNCILTGNNEDEIEQDSMANVGFQFSFDHCLVQSNLYKSHSSSFTACKFNEDAKFVDPIKGYFELDTLSPAKDNASLSIIQNAPYLFPLTYDLKGTLRVGNDAGPDIGVYERIESK